MQVSLNYNSSIKYIFIPQHLSWNSHERSINQTLRA
jgi:hypothetical protein